VLIEGLLELVVPVAILWANLAYLLVVSALLRLRLQGWPGRGGSGGTDVFALCEWGVPVELAAGVLCAPRLLHLRRARGRSAGRAPARQARPGIGSTGRWCSPARWWRSEVLITGACSGSGSGSWKNTECHPTRLRHSLLGEPVCTILHELDSVPCGAGHLPE